MKRIVTAICLVAIAAPAFADGHKRNAQSQQEPQPKQSIEDQYPPHVVRSVLLGGLSEKGKRIVLEEALKRDRYQ